MAAIWTPSSLPDLDGELEQDRVTGLPAALTAKADDSSVVKLAASTQTVTAGGVNVNPINSVLTLMTTETNYSSCLDLRKTVSGGNYIQRVFTPYFPEAASYIQDNGAEYKRTEIVCSSNSTGTGENYRINPPTLDRAWIMIWSDIDVPVQVRDSGLAGSRTYEILDTTGKYVFAIGNATGALLWGSTTAKDADLRPLYDTTLYRVGANQLKTDGSLTVVGELKTSGKITQSIASADSTFVRWVNPSATTGGYNWKIGAPGAFDGDLRLNQDTTGDLARWNQYGLALVGAKTVSFGANGGLTWANNGATGLYVNGTAWLMTGLTAISLSVNYVEKAAITAAGFSIGGGTPIASHLAVATTINFGSVGAGASIEVDVTVTGAVVGLARVTVNPRNSPESGLIFTARVKAADTVTVRCNNFSTSPIDPASNTYDVAIDAH